MPPANASQHRSDQEIEEKALRVANRLRPANLELVKALISSTGCMRDEDSPGRPIPMNEIRPIQILFMMEALADTESPADFARYWAQLTRGTLTEDTVRNLQEDVQDVQGAEVTMESKPPTTRPDTWRLDEGPGGGMLERMKPHD